MRNKLMVINKSLNTQELLKRFIHDIRSPLACLMMINETEDMQKIIKERIDLVIQRIKSITDSTEDKMKQKSQNSVICLNLLIDNLIIEKQYEKINCDINFIYNKSEQNITIHGIKDDFCRMLSNLLNNAIDACIDKTGMIKIDLTMINDVVTLSVSDNGCGMHQEILHKLQNKITVTYGKKNGHGIGMNQIRDTIDNLNGKLTIQSTLGIGSVFTIQFVNNI